MRQGDLRRELLEQILGAVGEDVEIRPPFHVDYGTNIRIGARTFVNFGLMALDVADITLGADCQLGPDVQLLTPEDANHAIVASGDGKYFIDVHSTIDTAPVAVLRDGRGTLVKELARADLARLKASGWVPPASFTVKARDGKTDLYGQLFKPSNFDASKKYPIVTYIYPGPQVGSVRSRSFMPAHGDHQALAELGFIVIAVDGMGTPLRSKSFQDAWYGDMADNTLPDQVAALKELAAKYPWIDATRAGMWGHSGGGNATATAMTMKPSSASAWWSPCAAVKLRERTEPTCGPG